MSSTTKTPKRPSRQSRTTLQFPKLPDRQFAPRRTAERKGQYIMKRWEAGSENVQTRALED